MRLLKWWYALRVRRAERRCRKICVRIEAAESAMPEWMLNGEVFPHPYWDRLLARRMKLEVAEAHLYRMRERFKDPRRAIFEFIFRSRRGQESHGFPNVRGGSIY